MTEHKDLVRMVAGATPKAFKTICDIHEALQPVLSGSTDTRVQAVNAALGAACELRLSIMRRRKRN